MLTNKNYFNEMMKVINLLKLKTGYIYKVRVNESGVYVDTSCLNNKRYEQLKTITNGTEQNNIMNITGYYKKELLKAI